jgi:hypothetical protein
VHTACEAAVAKAYHALVKERVPNVYATIAKWKASRHEFGPDRVEINGYHSCMWRHMFDDLAYLVELPQDEVLRQFDREEQKKIATWQIRVPSNMCVYNKIGFHPEQFHKKLRLGGVTESLGVSHGYATAWLYGGRDKVEKPYLEKLDPPYHGEKDPEVKWGRLYEYNEGDPFSFTLSRPVY